MTRYCQQKLKPSLSAVASCHARESHSCKRWGTGSDIDVTSSCTFCLIHLRFSHTGSGPAAFINFAIKIYAKGIMNHVAGLLVVLWGGLIAMLKYCSLTIQAELAAMAAGMVA